MSDKKQVLVIWLTFTYAPKFFIIPMNGAEWRYYTKAHDKYIGDTDEKAVYQIAAKVANKKEEGEGFGFDQVVCAWKDKQITNREEICCDAYILTGILP